jgi:hypothetical protein
MHLNKHRFLLLFLSSGGLLFLLAITGSLQAAVPTFASSSLRTGPQNTSASNTPQVSTACPAPGTARAAVMPPLALGQHPTIVYAVNGSSGQLMRYDVTTGQSVQIVQFNQAFVNTAQVSADGRWILVLSENSSESKLQLIRLDGRYLQTLYCLPGGTNGNGLWGVLWSPDQKQITFTQVSSNGTGADVYLLNIRTGALQVELKLSSTYYMPRAWLDNENIYITDLQLFSVPTTIYLLHTNNGPNQKLSGLKVIFRLKTGGTYGYFDFDRSRDSTRLFLTQTAFDKNAGPLPPSKLTAQPAQGGPQARIYQSQTLAITNIRVANNTTLLLTVNNPSDPTQNGLWKIKMDGSGLTPLAINAADQNFGAFALTPWSDVSRNGSMYTLQVLGNGKPPSSSLLFGSLSGGAPTTFASFTDGSQLNVVGWTNM